MVLLLLHCMTIPFPSHIEVSDITTYNAPDVNGIGEELYTRYIVLSLYAAGR